MDANIREITLDIRLDPLENPTRDLMNRVQFDKILFLLFCFEISITIVITNMDTLIQESYDKGTMYKKTCFKTAFDIANVYCYH